MKNKTRSNRLKLVQASNAVYMTCQGFNKSLQELKFVEKVKSARENFQLPKRMN